MTICGDIRVSIIVPVFNAGNTIEECLKSLLCLNFDDSYEIIFIDNNSTDNSVNIINAYVNNDKMRLLYEKKKNSYAARNTGIRHSRGKILAFTDADCFVDKNWLMNITRRLDEPEIGAVGGKILPYCPKTKLEYFGYEYIFNERKKPFFYLGAGNLAVKKDILKEIGLFDDEFSSGGDVDFSLKIQKKEYKLAYQSDAVVYHKHRDSLKDFFLQYFKYGKGWKKLIKNWHKKQKISIFCYHKKIISAIYHCGFFLILYFKFIFNRNKVPFETEIKVFTQLYLAIQDLAFFLGYIYPGA